MKSIYLVLALLLTSFCFAQNRKALLKEINVYKSDVCKSTSYQSLTNQQLLMLSAAYFTENHYQVYESNDTSITFIKKTTASIVTTDDKVKHLIYLEIQTINSLKKIILDDETIFYKDPFTGVDPPKGRGAFYLNKAAFYKYMYHNLCGNDVELSEKLKTKIEKYNKQQTKEKKQLIAERDF